MPYEARRLNENASGMTGRGAIAVYEASGGPLQDGSHTLAELKAPGFFPVTDDNGSPTAIADAVAVASRSPEVQALAPAGGLDRSWTYQRGQGLPIILRARNGIEIDMLYLTSHRTGTPPRDVPRLELRGGAWNHS